MFNGRATDFHYEYLHSGRMAQLGATDILMQIEMISSLPLMRLLFMQQGLRHCSKYVQAAFIKWAELLIDKTHWLDPTRRLQISIVFKDRNKPSRCLYDWWFQVWCSYTSDCIHLDRYCYPLMQSLESQAVSTASTVAATTLGAGGCSF